MSWRLGRLAPIVHAAPARAGRSVALAPLRAPLLPALLARASKAPLANAAVSRVLDSNVLVSTRRQLIIRSGDGALRLDERYEDDTREDLSRCRWHIGNNRKNMGCDREVPMGEERG